MTQPLSLYMPGFQASLATWSPRALEQLRDDLLQQRASARSTNERCDVEARLDILRAESKRRSGELTSDDLDKARNAGGAEPFNANKGRSEREGSDGIATRSSHQLALDFSRDDASPNSGRLLKAPDHSAPNRAERDGGGLDR